jgi:hypothetical protein
MHDVLGAAIQHAMRDAASPSGLRAVQEAVSEGSETSDEQPRHSHHQYKAESHTQQAREERAGISRGPGPQESAPQFKRPAHSRTRTSADIRTLPQVHEVNTGGSGGVYSGKASFSGDSGVAGIGMSSVRLPHSNQNQQLPIRMQWAEDSTHNEPQPQGRAAAPVSASKGPPIPPVPLQHASKLSFRASVGASPAVNLQA